MVKTNDLFHFHHLSVVGWTKEFKKHSLVPFENATRQKKGNYGIFLSFMSAHERIHYTPSTDPRPKANQLQWSSNDNNYNNNDMLNNNAENTVKYI